MPLVHTLCNQGASFMFKWLRLWSSCSPSQSQGYKHGEVELEENDADGYSDAAEQPLPDHHVMTVEELQAATDDRTLQGDDEASETLRMRATYHAARPSFANRTAEWVRTQQRIHDPADDL